MVQQRISHIPCSIELRQDSVPNIRGIRARNEKIHGRFISDDKYFVTFIDDYSRFTWVYFLHSKSEVSKVFKIFFAYIENQLSSCIKILSFDWEGEWGMCFIRFLKFPIAKGGYFSAHAHIHLNKME